MLKSFEQFVINEQHDHSYQIFCDLDGVLVDFNRGFQELADNPEKLTPKEYEAIHGENTIWEKIEKLGEDFWANLQWMKDGRELWDYLKQYNPIILSSPSRSDSCIAGKTKWVKQNLGIDQVAVREPEEFTNTTKLILAKHKHNFVKPCENILGKHPILVDDFKSKLKKWTAAGGTGVLHNDATDTIRVIEELMNGSDSTEQ